MENPGHLLSLKVMRVSRPALASAWEPFYSSSPSLSAHSTASVLSLQGKTPLPGHPKTLRDLTNVTELLTLPSAFGAIQLGETFSGALAVNNETAVAVDGVTLRVEMQTATNKILLAELGGPMQSLAAGDTLETIVHHEIKELGQHVLACTVTYLLPPGARQPLPSADPTADPNVQTFRKFYKFAVTNPLSVKTKVHTPRSPSALLSREEREKVFLEVHIQNLTQDPMWFERIVLDPAQGWHAEDANMLQTASSSDGKGGTGSLFSGSMAMMQPQDTRQYVYILSATSVPSFPAHHAPGSVIPLGRLDISWRSQLGEPGRLLTSMLSRRIPLLSPAQVQASRQPASALPLHLQLQRSATATPAPASHHSRPPSRSSTPPIGPVPYRPSSPFRNRPPSVPPVRPQSPSSFTTTASAPGIPLVPAADALDIDLAVRTIPRGPGAIRVATPFTIACTLSVSAPVLPIPGRARVVALAVQHVQLPQPGHGQGLTAAGVPIVVDLASPRPHAPGTTTPTSASGTLVGRPFSVLDDRTLVGSPRAQTFEEVGLGIGIGVGGEEPRMLPPPVPEPGDEERYARTAGVKYVGPSTIFLPPLHLKAPMPTTIPDGESDDESAESVETEEAKTLKAEGAWEVELVYISTRAGFMAVGGLRVFLVEDRVEDVGDVPEAERRALPQKLREWEVIGEVWVDSH